MNRSSFHRGSARARRAVLRLSPVAAGATAMLMSMATHAQQAAGPSTQPAAPADAAQTITVTGIRRGIENAINVKKNADGVVEAVSAEDIGKLPDVSIAESIARLPGLSAQRVAGRAQVISVRGLSPDFATTLLNGRELVSTGDNRSVEFDQYPSELLSGVTVYKTPDASLIGQGLSGTLDMQTVRPLNFGNRVISLNARGSRNSLGSAANADANGNRFSVSYIDQFADRTVGVTIGFAHQDTPVQENQVGLYEPWKVETRPGVPAGTFITDGIKALRRTGYTKRDGLMGTIEFRPSKAWTSTLDLFYSKAKQEDTANQFEVNLSGYNNNISTITPPPVNFTGVTVNGNKTLTAVTAENIYPLVRGIYNKREDEISAFGLNNQFKADHGILVSADISYSKANRNELNLENNQQLPVINATTLPLDNLQITGSSSNFTTLRPGLDYSDLSSLRLTNTIYGSGYGKVPSVKDELTGFKLVAKVPASSLISVLTDIDVGVNFAERSKDKQQPEGAISFGPGQSDTAVGSDLSYGLVNLGFAGVGSIPAWNVPAAVGRYMTFNPSATAPGLIAKSWRVQEDTTTAFVKGNIDTDFGGINLRGNVGVQLQRTTQSSDAIQLVAGQTVPATDSKSLTDVLPSINLAFGLVNDQTVRVALAKQVARPRVDQLRSSIEVNVSDSPDSRTGLRTPNGSSGNSQLDPWRAMAFDLSYEKYFGSKAYVAAAYFYKDLKSYIYTQTDPNFDFSQFVAGVPANPSNPGIGINRTGNFAKPVNGKGGKLQGVELTASLPFELLTPALKGFGIVASASFNKSNIKIRDPESGSSVGPDDIELPGLSKRVFNLTAYYERGGFEARISQRRRSDFIGEIGNFNGNRTLRYVVGESVVDAQVGYNFNAGSVKGLGLLFQVNNLTDSGYRTYHAGNKDRPLEYSKWGRSYLLGANYKF